MNPEEGMLRPQLLDRFGLSVQLGNPLEPQQRQAIVRTRLAFDEDPQALAAAHAPALHQLAAQLAAARAVLPRLDWSDAVLQHAAQRALAAGVDGMRADLVMLRAARALVALEGRDVVTPHDVDAVAELALAHRRADDVPPPAAAPAPPPPSGANPPPAQPGAAAPTPAPEGDWGALPPQPSGTTRVASIGAWPSKKA
jgi:magnesium chelatase subunit I